MNSNLSNTVSPQFNGKEENTRSKVWQQDTQLSQTDHAAVWAYSSTPLYKKITFEKGLQYASDPAGLSSHQKRCSSLDHLSLPISD